ncbi:nucleotide exchange factor GrpE [Leucobacter massiliensis]|uniref:Protein GrpE n=1 Tax=Leucobacter massiliensis TaxID=1686285 RepID=A0A2S9QNS6_9MICO|nr:nucleotide exchange factor GrpE [Leucobacter massiliensis]PRI11242.1 nucleotide exchange factor GrpE [Leucobacter massiliensis]
MANEEQRMPGDDPNAGEVPADRTSGPESADSGPEPQEEELTVEDILGAEQDADAKDADAKDADAASGASPAEEAENPYLEDLRRLTAEYANYRKRTEANAELEKQRAVAAAVTPLLAVLDDLDRAEQHGDLVEGSAFATIAQKLRGTMERFGVVAFGEKGEPFDPQLHEAIAQVPVPGTEQHTVLDVIERGYRIGDVELRPAKVAVAVGADG